jgi:hypothetical protein
MGAHREEKALKRFPNLLLHMTIENLFEINVTKQLHTFFRRLIEIFHVHLNFCCAMEPDVWYKNIQSKSKTATC